MRCCKASGMLRFTQHDKMWSGVKGETVINLLHPYTRLVYRLPPANLAAVGDWRRRHMAQIPTIGPMAKKAKA